MSGPIGVERAKFSILAFFFSYFPFFSISKSNLNSNLNSNFVVHHLQIIPVKLEVLILEIFIYIYILFIFS
jgi:hypothetical protein